MAHNRQNTLPSSHSLGVRHYTHCLSSKARKSLLAGWTLLPAPLPQVGNSSLSVALPRNCSDVRENHHTSSIALFRCSDAGAGRRWGEGFGADQPAARRKVAPQRSPWHRLGPVGNPNVVSASCLFVCLFVWTERWPQPLKTPPPPKAETAHNSFFLVGAFSTRQRPRVLAWVADLGWVVGGGEAVSLRPHPPPPCRTACRWPA